MISDGPTAYKWEKKENNKTTYCFEYTIHVIGMWFYVAV